jgi:hypothetical protein
LSRESLKNSFSQLFSAIELCTAGRLRGAALILLYAAIDIAAWIGSDRTTVKARFTEWVDKYLLPGTSLKCSALDLYGARCGLLHSHSADSDLSRAGIVTELGYAWKPSTAHELEQLVQASVDLHARAGSKGQGDYFIAVQAEDLIGAFQKGVEVFLNDLDEDASKMEAASVKTARVLSDLSTEKASDMLQKAQEILTVKVRESRPKLRPVRRPGRNDPCHCGSGKKFKRCCGR